MHHSPGRPRTHLLELLKVKLLLPADEFAELARLQQPKHVRALDHALKAGPKAARITKRCHNRPDSSSAEDVGPRGATRRQPHPPEGFELLLDALHENPVQVALDE